jgi:hypothetical protein
MCHHVADNLIHEWFQQFDYFVVLVLEVHLKVQVFILASRLQQIFSRPCCCFLLIFQSLLCIHLLHHFYLLPIQENIIRTSYLFTQCWNRIFEFKHMLAIY